MTWMYSNIVGVNKIMDKSRNALSVDQILSEVDSLYCDDDDLWEEEDWDDDVWDDDDDDWQSSTLQFYTLSLLICSLGNSLKIQIL